VARTVLVAVGAAIVLGVVGFLIGGPLAAAKVQRYVDVVYVSDPRQLEGVKLATAMLFAWPALAAAIAAGVVRWRRGEWPTLRTMVGYGGILAVVIGAFDLSRWWFFPMPAGNVQPMLLITTFAPGATEAQVGVFATIVLCLYLGVRTRDSVRVR